MIKPIKKNTASNIIWRTFTEGTKPKQKLFVSAVLSIIVLCYHQIETIATFFPSIKSWFTNKDNAPFE